MLSTDEIDQAATQLRRLVNAVEAGTVECRPEQLAHLRGSLAVLEELASRDAVRDTDV